MVYHTHTVVRECCKDDDASQWKSLKFDSSLRQNSLTVTEICIGEYVVNIIKLDIYPSAKFYPDLTRSLFFPYGWNCAPLDSGSAIISFLSSNMFQWIFGSGSNVCGCVRFWHYEGYVLRILWSFVSLHMPHLLLYLHWTIIGGVIDTDIDIEWILISLSDTSRDLATLTFNLGGHVTCGRYSCSCSICVSSLKFVGLSVRKIWHTSGLSISRSGDLDLDREAPWPWRSRRLSAMRVFVLRLYTKFEVLRPSRSGDIAHYVSINRPGDLDLDLLTSK